MSDEDFLAYCLAKCEGETVVLPANHARRLFQLAGKEWKEPGHDSWSYFTQSMLLKELVGTARARLVGTFKP